MSQSLIIESSRNPKSRLPDPVIFLASKMVLNTGIPTRILDTEDDPEGLTLVFVEPGQILPNLGTETDYEANQGGIFAIAKKMESGAEPGTPPQKVWVFFGDIYDMMAEIRRRIAAVENPVRRNLLSEGLRFCYLNLNTPRQVRG